VVGSAVVVEVGSAVVVVVTMVVVVVTTVVVDVIQVVVDVIQVVVVVGVVASQCWHTYLFSFAHFASLSFHM
jgi:hypothetical protein